MELDFSLYGDKKELNILISSSKEIQDKLKQIITDGLNLSIPLNLKFFEEERSIIDFIAAFEYSTPLVIFEKTKKNSEIIRKINENLSNCKTTFIVLYEEKEEVENISFKNTILLPLSFLEKNFFLNFLYISLSSWLNLIFSEQSIKKIKKCKNELNKEKLIKNSILNSVKEGVLILDTEGNILHANKMAEYILELQDKEYQNTSFNKYLKIPEDKGEKLMALYEECQLKKKRLRKNMTIFSSQSERNYIVNYEFVPILDNNRNIAYILFIFDDVTLNKKMWDELSKKKNLEMLGLISEGIIHDLNNQLTTVLANINLVKENCKDEETYDYIIDIENAALKTKNIIGEFVSFSKGGVPFKKKGNIKELVEEVVHLLFRGTNIHISISAENNLSNVEFDHSLMAQALKNILINSKEAISRSGNIIIKIGNQTIPEKNPYSVKGGKYIKLSIEDDGIGIPKELIDKIFYPNFSTKGKDRGLGLSMVESIISSHNGFIRVDSREKIGTAFHIFLPASEKQQKTNKICHGTINKNSNVLVLSHDHSMIKVLEKIFKYFEVCSYFLPKRRITDEDFSALFNEKTYQYLIIDLSGIGERNIEKIIEKVRNFNTNMKIIIFTHNHLFDPQKVKNLGINAVLYKPFTLEEFGNVFGEIL